ncbi:hypothetical protein ACXDF8_18780 [Mycolicibacterium sp. CBM1]
MTALRVVGGLGLALAALSLGAAPARADSYAQLGAVPVVASPTCAGSVSADASVAPVQIDDRVENAVRVAIHYDAGVYDGSCALTVTAEWNNVDTGASGSGDITAVSTVDGHYGFVGYASTTFEPGPGTVVIRLSSHPGAELRVEV